MEATSFGVYSNADLEMVPPIPPAHYSNNEVVDDEVTYQPVSANDPVPGASYEDIAHPIPAARPSAYRKNPAAKDSHYMNHRYGRHREYANPEILNPDSGIGLDNDSVSGIHPAAQFSLPSKPAEYGEDYPYYNTDTTASNKDNNVPFSQMFQQAYLQYQNSLARTRPNNDAW